MTKAYFKIALGAFLLSGIASTSSLAQGKTAEYPITHSQKTNAQSYAKRNVIAPPVRQRRVIRIEHPTQQTLAHTTRPLIKNLQYNPSIKPTRNYQTHQTSRTGMPVMAPQNVKAPMTIIVDRHAASAR